MPEHDNAAEYWLQRYEETVAEHNRELTEYRKHLGNKYKPVLDRILEHFEAARNSAIIKMVEGTPPNENSNWAPPSVKIENGQVDTPK